MPDATSGAALAPRPEHPSPRGLDALVERLVGLGADPTTHGDVGGTRVTGCTHDSRAVQPGDLYAALPGARTHGARHVDQALRQGAVAVLTDPEGVELAGPALHDVPVVRVRDPRGVLGATASYVHGDPASRLLLLGVTGTNGKTTTSYLVEAGLRAAGHRTGLVGTVETLVAGSALPSERTSPEATDLHALLALMVERGVTAAVTEVSSHALSLGRVDGVRYDVGLFTNLTQDHLDFHGSMAGYEAAKARLFTPGHARRGVLVVDPDDPSGGAGQRLADGATVPVTTLGAPGADWQVEDVRLAADGSQFRLRGPGTDVPVRTALPGTFNVRNAALAVAGLVTAGVAPEDAAAGVATLRGVPGRLERVEAGQPFLALVDYAHTPDAVETVLRAVRPLAGDGGRVLVVLGCGGDRDRAKRPLMGRAAVECADVVHLTSDNPRSEDPLLILNDMTVGLDRAAATVLVEPDRRRAIALAVAAAGPGDVLVVAGKGHEAYQEVAGVRHPFDDRLVLAEEIARATETGAP